MTRLVYSTDPDRSDRTPAPRKGLSPGEHDVRVRRERAGRRGKTVTVAGPFRLASGELRALLKRLKQICGSGGTAKPASAAAAPVPTDLEIQGDHVERVIAELAALGYPAKRSGG